MLEFFLLRFKGLAASEEHRQMQNIYCFSGSVLLDVMQGTLSLAGQYNACAACRSTLVTTLKLTALGNLRLLPLIIYHITNA